ncbi:MAG TPA: hypothetical protein VMC08_09090, partial [Bacteroidales bacterium]|nr:hypothetical protein [Bacteroidales bacterium]
SLGACKKKDNSSSTDTDQDGYFADGTTFTGYDFTNGSGTERDAISGSITIGKNRNQFLINYHVVTTTHDTIPGIFSGPLPDISNWITNGKL